MKNGASRGLLPFAFAACMVCGVADLGAASSETGAYPARPIRIMVGFPAGTGNDLLARVVGARLSERFGQQVVVENRPGANGIIAAELTSRAAPDGHTVMVMSASHTMNAALYKLPFDAVKSFTPVTTLATGSLVLAANAAFPASGVKGLIEIASAKPGSVTYGVSGTGGVSHFAGALFARTAGIQMVDVPYKGGPQALTDLIAGQVQILFGTLPLTLSHVRSGRIKALGVSSVKRSPLLPEVPTIAESGLPGYQMSIWWGTIAPPRLPAGILGRLNTEIGTALAHPDVVKRLEAEGAVLSPSSSAEFARLLALEVERWSRVAREAGIKAE